MTAVKYDRLLFYRHAYLLVGIALAVFKELGLNDEEARTCKLEIVLLKDFIDISEHIVSDFLVIVIVLIVLINGILGVIVRELPNAEAAASQE